MEARERKQTIVQQDREGEWVLVGDRNSPGLKIDNTETVLGLSVQSRKKEAGWVPDR